MLMQGGSFLLFFYLVMNTLKPVKFCILEKFMYNDELVLCLINIKSKRNLICRHSMQPCKTFHWLDAKHWAEFEEGLETTIQEYFQKKSFKKCNKSFNIGCDIRVNLRKPQKQPDVLRILEANNSSGGVFFECDIDCNGLLNNNSIEPQTATAKKYKGKGGTTTAKEAHSPKPSTQKTQHKNPKPHVAVENALEESDVTIAKPMKKDKLKEPKDKSNSEEISSRKRPQNTYTKYKTERIKEKSIKHENRANFTKDLFGTDDDSDSNSKAVAVQPTKRETRADKSKDSTKKPVAESSSGGSSKSKDLPHSKKSSKKVKPLSIADMGTTAILNTFDQYKPILDEVFRTEHQKFNVSDYNGVDHYCVIHLLDDNMQMEMLKKLADTYHCNETQEFTHLFTNAMLPEWMLHIIMTRYSLSRSEALEQINNDITYDALHTNVWMPMKT